MDIMEKVEQLTAKADISYEEAKAVLEEANGDLLDAVILLEQRGKIRKPETELIQYAGESISDENPAAGEKTRSDDHIKEGARKMKNAIRKIVNVLRNNTFHVSRKGESLFSVSAWAFALILLFFWHTVIPVMIIALFFDVRYSFTGKDDLTKANQFMDKAGSIADEVCGEFR